MPNQRIPDEDPQDRCEQERQIDCVVLSFMFNEPWPWSVEEIAREYGDTTEAAASIRRLTETGLVHRLGEFVIPTHAARRAAEIEIGTA
jgi:hypothetical protein